MTERSINLVVPLAHKATAKRITDTAGSSRARSGAVSPLIGASLRQGDVNSTHMDTSPTSASPGIRTSTTTSTRTTTTSRLSCASARSADRARAPIPAGCTFKAVVEAYFNCRRNKRNTASALAFEHDLENNLRWLHADLISGRYRPGQSICFVVTRPKPREVWAADFRDRIVHHLLYDHISPRFYAGFIADSCACVPGRGTLYGARRLEAKVRSVTQNWQHRAFYLKLDLANFFVSIDKRVLREQLAAKVHEPWWLWLAETILFHDPRDDFELRGNPRTLDKVPPHKRLANQVAHRGLPIGNLSSQFFANVYLDALDQFVKHRIGAKHYIRYVDDFVLLHPSPQWLNAARKAIEAFLPATLGVQLNPTKTILQPLERGVDFVGQVIKPWARTTRRRTRDVALARLEVVHEDDFVATANSYFGLARQAGEGHTDQARIARAVLRRMHCVNRDLTKTYSRSGAT